MPELRALEEVLPGEIEGLTLEPGEPVVLRVTPGSLLDLARLLRHDTELAFELLYSVSGLDRGEEGFETVYHVWSPERQELAVVKVGVPPDMTVPSVAAVWPTAGWHERECYDMFGILFEGHPDLRHLLVLDAERGYLLRKDVRIRTIEEARARAD